MTEFLSTRRRWRWILPSVHLALYIALVRSSGWPPPNDSVAFDLGTPTAIQVAFAINSPAYVGANILMGVADLQGELLFLQVVGILSMPQWWVVGWWLEQFTGRAQQAGLRSRRGFHVGLWACVFVVAAAWVSSCWWHILRNTDLDRPNLVRSAPHTLQIVFGCIVWPAFAMGLFLGQMRAVGRVHHRSEGM